MNGSAPILPDTVAVRAQALTRGDLATFLVAVQDAFPERERWHRALRTAMRSRHCLDQWAAISPILSLTPGDLQKLRESYTVRVIEALAAPTN